MASASFQKPPASGAGLAISSQYPNISFIEHLSRMSAISLNRLLRLLKLYAIWYLAILLVFWTSKFSMAQDIVDPEPILNCSTVTDNYVGNAQLKFQFANWVNRGLCIRNGTDGGGPLKTFQCYSRLQNVLSNNLNEIRKAEYGGAAGVLALLPTIGALLGTPTNEIWRLLTMIPFGGFLAMACSFGGAILPVSIKDYESSFMKKNITGTLRGHTSSTFSLPISEEDLERERTVERGNILIDRVQRKLKSDSRKGVPKMYIWIGLTGMTVLLGAAHVAMIVIELGAVLPWWCISKWWVHLWYMMVICSAAIDNYVQLPFEKQWRLCLSDVPYDLTVIGGNSITNHITGDKHDDEVENVRIAVQQPDSMKTGTVDFAGRYQHPAKPRNTLFVLISVASQSHTWRRTFTRSISKISSIAVFIVGTACFASAQLLSIAMATFVLTCVLGAGVFGRAITSWIVAGIETVDPMLHFVAKTEEEAHYILYRLFTVGKDERPSSQQRQVQIEMHGHVFLDQRRVTTRSPWPTRILGILAAPFDLAKIVGKKSGPDNHLKQLEEGTQSNSGIELVQPLSARTPLTRQPTSGTDTSEPSQVAHRTLSRHLTSQ